MNVSTALDISIRENAGAARWPRHPRAKGFASGHITRSRWPDAPRLSVERKGNGESLCELFLAGECLHDIGCRLSVVNAHVAAFWPPYPIPADRHADASARKFLQLLFRLRITRLQSHFALIVVEFVVGTIHTEIHPVVFRDDAGDKNRNLDFSGICLFAHEFVFCWRELWPQIEDDSQAAST